MKLRIFLIAAAFGAVIATDPRLYAEHGPDAPTGQQANEIPPLSIDAATKETTTSLGCCLSVDCSDYRGENAKTESGRDCQPWNSNEPHKHNLNENSIRKLSGLTENNCRNPSGHKTAWCYTMDENKRWENCKIPSCSDIQIRKKIVMTKIYGTMGIMYTFVDEAVTWTEASAACEKMGAKLATPRSNAENDFLEKVIPVEDKYYWIGAYCHNCSHGGEDKWTWITGEDLPITFPRWAIHWGKQCPWDGNAALDGWLTVYKIGDEPKDVLMPEARSNLTLGYVNWRKMYQKPKIVTGYICQSVNDF